jgi:flavin-dependent dehydrogenase
MFDVVVVGGGPAGSTVAGALARRGRSVVLVERSAYDAYRVGEALGAEAFVPLKSVGAWDAMRELVEAQVPLRSVRAAWGSDEAVERPSIVHPLGEGRHVDRARFDARLAQWAESTGVDVRRDAGACTVARSDEGFRVEPARGAPLAARYFVDASGRGAPASARLRERRWLALDRQIAVVARMETGRDVGWDVLVEAAPEGWWYSVPQPGGALVVALVTDADLEGERASLEGRFHAALDRTLHTAGRCQGVRAVAPPRIVRADSGRLLPGEGPGWCAVGDAAMASDPLGGNGVARALRGALEAATRIDARLADDAAAVSHPPPIDRRLLDYLDRRASYYALEARWQGSLFWLRRRPMDWRRAPLTLAPTALLTRGSSASRASLAAAEALVPPRAVASAIASLTTPTPAHVVLSALRAAAPLEDGRLLVALQTLVTSGAVAVSA